MVYKFRKFFYLMTLMFCCQQVLAGSPVLMLEKAANNVLVELKTNKATIKAKPNYVNTIVHKYIIPEVDVYGMARSVLGRNQWRKASQKQRKYFTHNFVRLVVRTYSRALKDYSGEKVIFSPIRGGYKDRRFVKVSSVIKRSNGQNIPISYSLVSKKGKWKIYDMSVEGVSLLQSYRSQFAQYLKDNNIDGLIKKLKTQKIKA